MLPKKGRKETTVNGVLYHYVVKGFITVIIRNSITGAIIRHYEDVKPKWGVYISPADVKRMIENKDLTA